MRTSILIALLQLLAPGVFPGEPIWSVDRPVVQEPSFQWKEAFVQGSRFLAIQHAFRLTMEPGTRAALGGSFVRDYGRSLRGLRGWDDGDPFLVNYVGHPMQGAVAGYISVHNDREGVRSTFGRSRSYWDSRMRAALFSAAYSMQFEVGPFSEATIGNIQANGKETGIVDWVITPTLGFGWMLAEDALDETVVRWLERRTGNRTARAIFRSALNPSRSFANLLRMKFPWWRDTREN